MMNHQHHSSCSSVVTLSADTPILLSPRIAVSPPSDINTHQTSANLTFQFPVTNNGANVDKQLTGGWRRKLSRHRARSSSVSRSTDALVQASALALTQPLSIDIQLSGPPPIRASSASDLPCHASLLSPPPHCTIKRYATGGTNQSFRSACDLRLSGSNTTLAGGRNLKVGGKKGRGLRVDLNKSDNDVTRMSVTSSEESTGVMTSSSNDSSARQSSLESNGSPGPWPPPNPAQPPPSPGPRYSLVHEADVQVCCLNHARTVVSKVLSSRFLRRWETLRLRLNEADIEADEGSGLLQRPLTYASMQDVYTVNRWDASGRYCLRIVVPDGSVLLQAASSYTRDQWFHSIVWKKNLHKFRSVLSQARTSEVILKELKCLVDFAATTPLQDDCIMNEPIAIVSELLDHPEHICSRASLLRTSAPLLEDAPPSASLCRHVAKYCLHPYDELDVDSNKESNNDSLSFSAVERLVRRILKHGADYSTSPHARDLVRDYLTAIGVGVGGHERLGAFVESVHGPGSACPHPRVLPNLASVCFAGITNRFEELSEISNKAKVLETPDPIKIEKEIKDFENSSVEHLNKINQAQKNVDDPITLTNILEPNILENTQDDVEQQNLKNEALEKLDGANNENTNLGSTKDAERKIEPSDDSMNLGNKDDDTNLEHKNVETKIEERKNDEVLDGTNLGTKKNLEVKSDIENIDSTINTNANFTQKNEAQKSNTEFSIEHKEEVVISYAEVTAQQNRESYSSNNKTKELLNPSTNFVISNNLSRSLDNTTKVLNQTKQLLIQGLRTQKQLEHSKEMLASHADEEDETSNEDTGSYRTCLDVEYGPDCEEICKVENESKTLDPQVAVFINVLELLSAHNSWLPHLASLIQPLPFPATALLQPGFLDALVPTIRRLATSRQCEVHRSLVGVRQSKKGWLDLYCPVTGEACPDGGKLWCQMLSTLLTCCGRRKRFLLQHLIPARLPDCFQLAIHPWAGPVRLVLALGIEWDLLGQDEEEIGPGLLGIPDGNEDDYLQKAVGALMCTQRGREVYAEACERRSALEKIRRTGGPRRLALPPRATDQDLADLLSAGPFGDLRSLCLAFTRVTGACAEQIIKLPSLRQLNLWATQFDDAGLQLLAENLPQLRQLNLCETRVTDAGIASLASLKHLRTLNLNSTSLSASTLQELRNKLPDLQDCDVRYTEAW